MVAPRTGPPRTAGFGPGERDGHRDEWTIVELDAIGLADAGAAADLLEAAEDGLLFSSGMAAISTVMLAFLSSGDHAVIQRDIYGGTHHLITADFDRFRIDLMCRLLAVHRHRP